MDVAPLLNAVCICCLCVQMRELHSLGFRDMSQCEEALRLSGGEVKGALSLLQRPLLEPFHQRIWTAQNDPPIDPKHPDKQVGRHRKSPEGFWREHLVPLLTSR